MIDHRIRAGLTMTSEKKTTSSDAHITDSSTINYLVSTPAILSIVIDMSGKMLDPLLPNDFITVGKNIQLEHNHPTLIGEIIKIKTTVEKIEDHKIYLDIEVSDTHGICCSGKYERTIVNKNKLLEIAYHRI